MSENYGPAQGPGPVPNYGGPGYGPQGAGAPPAPAKKPIWKRTWFIATAAGLLGLMLGAGGSSDATVAPKAAPTVTTTATATVTETSTPEPAPTVTETVAGPTVTVTADAPTIEPAGNDGVSVEIQRMALESVLRGSDDLKGMCAAYLTMGLDLTVTMVNSELDNDGKFSAEAVEGAFDAACA